MKQSSCRWNQNCGQRVLFILVITATSLVAINSAFVTAIHNNSNNTPSIRSKMALGTSSKDDDVTSEVTKEFHQLASAAVDLSNAHVSETGILSSKHIITVYFQGASL